MLDRIATLAIAAPRRIIAIAVLVMVGAAIFGIPVTKSLANGGFQDPTSESWHASRLLSDKFGLGDNQMIIAVTSDAGVHSEGARAVGTDLVAQLKRLPFVTGLQSAWTAPPQGEAALVSRDGRTGLILAGITGGETGAQEHAKQVRDLLPHVDGVTVSAGGEVMSYAQTIDQTNKDLLVMEAIAVPLSFGLLVWVFGGLLAAALPLAVGMFAILGSMAVMRAITFATEVSVFALNLTLALGLALAIDYTLLIVSRFRDEVADGAGREEALTHTMATAGRTVLFSAVPVGLSMLVMALFPMPFLQSFAYAGVAVVAFAAIAAMVVTPAAIVLLGDRLDALDVRRFARRLLGRPAPVARPVEQTIWYRWTKAVMRRSIPIGLAIVALLLVLGTPFLGVKWGYPDDRVLPGSAQARQVGDELRRFCDQFPNRCDRADSAHGRGDGDRTQPLRRGAVARTGRVVGIVTGRHARQRNTGRACLGRNGIERRQRVLDRQLHRPAVLEGVGSPAGSAARLRNSWRPRRPADRVGTDQSRQLRSGDFPAAAGAVGDRRDHLPAVVLVDRQRCPAAKGVAAQRVVVDRCIRRAGMDLPGRPPRRVRHDGDRHIGGQCPGAVVLPGIRVVDGLRGVLDLADSGVLAGHRQDPGRQR